MNAKFGIYKDCSSNEPTKVYECKRLLFGISKKALSIYNQMQKTDDENEQIEALVDLIQTIFPNFERNEIDYVDAKELIAFVNEIVDNTTAELHKSQKN